MHKFVVDNEAKGIHFHRIDFKFWKDNPGINTSNAKLTKTLKDSMSDG